MEPRAGLVGFVEDRHLVAGVARHAFKQDAGRGAALSIVEQLRTLSCALSARRWLTLVELDLLAVVNVNLRSKLNAAGQIRSFNEATEALVVVGAFGLRKGREVS